MAFAIPILFAVISAVAMYQVSAWRTARELDARSRPLRDPALEPLFERLATALDIEHLQVHLYDIPQVNGLAAPDGRILITRGFLDRFKAGEITGAELSSVVAHEVGHVALGHSRRRVLDAGGQNAARVALAMTLGRFLPGIGPLIAGLAGMLLSARLSRQDEYEADAYAAALLTRAGIGTKPQVSLFRKLERMSAQTGAPAWLASHPSCSDRIAAIRRIEDSWRS